MKKYSKLLLVLLIGVLAISACKGATPVPENMPTKPSDSDKITESVDEEEPANEDGENTAQPTEEPQAAVSAEDPFSLKRTSTDPLTTDDGRMVCTPSEPLFAPLTEEKRAQYNIPDYPEISDEDWVKGPKDALLTIYEYTDFQCPYCSLFNAEARKLLAAYPDKIRLVYRPLPLSFHNLAPLAAQAAEAAGAQEKFWEMKDYLFDKQQEWASLTLEGFNSWLGDAAKELGLDEEKFAKNLESDQIVEKIKTLTEKATSIGINSTPSLVINGYPWQQSYTVETFGQILDVLEAESKLSFECPPFDIDVDKKYTATMETEKGKMVFELYPNVAPLAVNSFVHLARKGFYNGVTFHRVLENFMAQGGDPTGSGMSGPGYSYMEETHPELLFDKAGLLAVARTNTPGSSGSQFFITFEPADWLSGNYTIMGRLIEGEDVLKSITIRDPQAQPAPDFEGDKIIKITIEEK